VSGQSAKHLQLEFGDPPNLIKLSTQTTHNKCTKTSRRKRPAALSAVVGAMVAGGFTAHAQTAYSTNKLEQENQELRKRWTNGSKLLEKEGLKPSGSGMAADPPVAAMTSVTISGFVEASYFSDVADTHDNHPPGYLWNTPQFLYAQ
jgi:benzoyl-CoA reductase/2-hydroxyglutaryl-CoA dehydratase subunit BcrC/BadD/HgdB